MSTISLAGTAETAERAAPRRRRWFRQPALLAGGVLLAIILFMVIAAPLITSYNPDTQNLTATLQGFSGKHWLGTDQEGRDTFTRLLYGGRTDLQVAFLAVLFPFVLGTILGSVAGYFGGWVDIIIMRLVDIVVAFPFFVLIIALVFVLGPGPRSIYIAITLVGWVSYARIIRGEILVAKRQEYVLAAQSGGLLQPADHGQASAAERDHAGDHLRDVRHRAGHPRHRHPELLGPRHSATDSGLGNHDLRRPELPYHALAADDDPGRSP